MKYSQLSVLQKQEIEEVLADFGLSKREQKIYIGLLQIGKTSLTPLARVTQETVTTVQSVMKRLVALGIVKVTKKKSRHYYEADNPRIFVTLLREQSEQFKTILPLLQEIKSDTEAAGAVQVFYGSRMKDAAYEALSCKNKIIYEIVSARDFQNVLGEKFHMTRRRMEKGIRLKSLRVRAHEIKKYNEATHKRELREAKFLPKDLTFTMSIAFWDNKVVFFSERSEGVAILVSSRSIREGMQQLFDMLWSVSGNMETK